MKPHAAPKLTLDLKPAYHTHADGSLTIEGSLLLSLPASISRHRKLSVRHIIRTRTYPRNHKPHKDGERERETTTAVETVTTVTSDKVILFLPAENDNDDRIAAGDHISTFRIITPGPVYPTVDIPGVEIQHQVVAKLSSSRLTRRKKGAVAKMGVTVFTPSLSRETPFRVVRFGISEGAYEVAVKYKEWIDEDCRAVVSIRRATGKSRSGTSSTSAYPSSEPVVPTVRGPSLSGSPVDSRSRHSSTEDAQASPRPRGSSTKIPKFQITGRVTELVRYHDHQFPPRRRKSVLESLAVYDPEEEDSRKLSHLTTARPTYIVPPSTTTMSTLQGQQPEEPIAEVPTISTPLPNRDPDEYSEVLTIRVGGGQSDPEPRLRVDAHHPRLFSCRHVLSLTFVVVEEEHLTDGDPPDPSLVRKRIERKEIPLAIFASSDALTLTSAEKEKAAATEISVEERVKLAARKDSGATLFGCEDGSRGSDVR